MTLWNKVLYVQGEEITVDQENWDKIECGEADSIHIETVQAGHWNQSSSEYCIYD